VVSPVFRHGRLRLYLLKLLDEAPRHGYEVIRLLQDRFLGVYAPSPGTIYPRLARLEEDGLVTHDEVDGKKVYRITEKGREEIRGRLDDLADLEEELAESVRDIAREVTEDVRQTVRSLREELTWVARDVRKEGRAEAREAEAREAEAPRHAQDRAKDERRTGQDENQRAKDEGRTGQDEEQRARDEARRVKDEARRAREDMRDRFHAQRGGGRREWADRAGWQDWPGWASWQSRPGGGRPGGGGPGGGGPGGDDRARAGGRERPGARSRFERGDSGRPDAGLFRDLERMAIEFARELRSAAGHAEDVGERGLGDLWGILDDALTRIKDEVFGGNQDPADDEGAAQADRAAQADHADEPDGSTT
jgi:DNA-binding PadR family transcriptional regulator